jgi:hypothetical protein
MRLLGEDEKICMWIVKAFQAFALKAAWKKFTQLS